MIHKSVSVDNTWIYWSVLTALEAIDKPACSNVGFRLITGQELPSLMTCISGFLQYEEMVSCINRNLLVFLILEIVFRIRRRTFGGMHTIIFLFEAVLYVLTFWNVRVFLFLPGSKKISKLFSNQNAYFWRYVLYNFVIWCPLIHTYLTFLNLGTHFWVYILFLFISKLYLK